MSLLERHVRELEQLLSARNTGTADSVSPGLIAGLLALALAQPRWQLLWTLFLLGRGVGEGAGAGHWLCGLVSSHPSRLLTSFLCLLAQVLARLAHVPSLPWLTGLNSTC